MSLPREIRRSDGVPRAVIQREWPELLRWPVNQLSLLRRARRAGLVRIRRLSDSVQSAAVRAFSSNLGA
jgi:hypothetical protein